MDRLYQTTFDQVRMPEERAQRLRAELASRCSHHELEAISMNNSKKIRRPAMAMVAVFVIAALSLTAFAYGETIVDRVYNMMTGGMVEHGTTEDGTAYASGSYNADEAVPPVERREDGRLYLTVNGENLDITDQCSYETPYLYECTGPDGLRHAFIIGGGLDAIGWAEFLWNENGLPEAGSAVFGTPGGAEDAPWLEQGKDELNLPW